MFVLGLIAAFISLVFLSLSDVFTKTITNAYKGRVATLSTGFTLIPMLVYLVIFPPIQITLPLLLIVLGGGVCDALGYILVLKSLETEQSSNTWALLNLPCFSLILIGIFGLGESVTLIQVAAMAAIFIGAGMVTINKGFKFNRLLLPAIIGMFIWIGYNLLLVYSVSSYMPSASFIIFTMWMISAIILLAYNIATKQTKSKEFKKLIEPKLTKPKVAFIVCGILLGVGQTVFLETIFQQTVAVAGAVLAIEPILVVIIAYFVYKERMTLLQKLGVLITVIGGIVISLL